MEQHVFDDCIGNPPFSEALKTLEGGIDTEWKLTEAQQRFFDEKKEKVLNLPEDATEREKELAKAAKIFIGYAENLQKKLNRMNDERTAAMERAAAMERTAAMERAKQRTDFSKAWGAMVACYRAIDRHFGDEIRAHLEKNDRTQKEGQLRKAMAEVERLSKL